MIAFLRGNIIETGPRYAVVDTGSVGYKVWLTDDTLHSIETNKDAAFWTYLAVRENSQDLYGFPKKSDRDFFELLISVSGIGPKSALNILSLVASETLASAVRTGSTSHLVKVSGIGKKTAEKIVLELKDKLGLFTGSQSPESMREMSSDSDTIEALKALGYETDDAREALKKIDKNISDTGAKVKAALKLLS
ncbi:MAG: Holliday junction branch migration protein RuvA [Candidatus Paceibacterota bacterium]|jgi:Holliday junction DNA helicase RuvA